MSINWFQKYCLLSILTLDEVKALKCTCSSLFHTMSVSYAWNSLLARAPLLISFASWILWSISLSVCTEKARALEFGWLFGLWVSFSNPNNAPWLFFLHHLNFASTFFPIWQNYFSDPWNSFDFIIVVGSFVDIFFGKLGSDVRIKIQIPIACKCLCHAS